MCAKFSSISIFRHYLTFSLHIWHTWWNVSICHKDVINVLHEFWLFMFRIGEVLESGHFWLGQPALKALFGRNCTGSTISLAGKGLRKVFQHLHDCSPYDHRAITVYPRFDSRHLAAVCSKSKIECVFSWQIPVQFGQKHILWSRTVCFLWLLHLLKRDNWRIAWLYCWFCLESPLELFKQLLNCRLFIDLNWISRA